MKKQFVFGVTTSSMDYRNKGIDFDKNLIDVPVCESAIHDYVKILLTKRTFTKECQIAWSLRAVTFMDLTTLSGNDSKSNVALLCHKATQPIAKEFLKKLGFVDADIKTAAVCVYPSRVLDCKETFVYLKSKINIAAVASGFPSGQYGLKSRLMEIEQAVLDGATEIDVVINRDLALCGKWKELYEEVKLMKAACGENVAMKAILATGELGSFSSIYKASLACMMAGANFIKTSTGKEIVNATLPVGVVMARAIKDYFAATHYKVGLKPAGGIKTSKDAISWMVLVKEILGDDWLKPSLFRIGASGLLGFIERDVFHYITGCVASDRNYPYL